MEIAAKRILLLSIGLCVFGLAAEFQTKAKPINRTEEWVEDSLPTQIGNFHMVPSAADPKVSYRADPTTYEKLKPYGIVARIFDDGKKQYDSMVVAGNDRNCFHDPNVCFPSQKWKILDEKIISLPTRTRGTVPVTLMTTEGETGKLIALFCYKGPHGIKPTQNGLYSDWFWTELKLGQPGEGAFFRFMTTVPDDTAENLMQFAAAYLDEATEMSKGVL